MSLNSQSSIQTEGGGSQLGVSQSVHVLDVWGQLVEGHPLSVLRVPALRLHSKQLEEMKTHLQTVPWRGVCCDVCWTPVTQVSTLRH